MAAYNFIDVNEVSDGFMLPSEALQINGDFIEHLISGYRTLNVTGREALSPELTYFETGVRDGSVIQSRRYPARTIIVKYQLVAHSPEEFREAYNKLASILNVQDAELIFNDEQDKYFVGTPSLIGTVEPGLNAVVGEIEFFCADPFKYSVVEYETVPRSDDNSIMIEYNGTYKSYPTLEAEFYEEDESKAALAGHGDCGYVAFFNENKKIIQLGDPSETDTESYAKSQTLVSQKFQTETAWGTTAQTNWAMNSGKLAYQTHEQTGSVNMTVASHVVTTAPSTSGTLLTKTSKVVKPYVDYKVTAQSSSRTAESVNVKVTVTTALQIKTNSGATTPTAGAKVTLNKTKLYVSSTASSDSGTKTGTYYLWDGAVKNGRIRITNTKSNVGKSGQVTGWVKTADISLSSGSTSGSSIGKGYGLRGAIQINGGDWNYVTIKSESSNWKDNSSHTATVTVTVKDLTADTELLEDIKFKVERTDSKDGNVGILDETACKDLEISTYTAPVPDTWYLMPETYGTGSEWHGPSITRTIPADDAGDTGAKNFTFSYRQKMSIGRGSAATEEYGAFQALLISGSGSSRKIVAGVSINKVTSGKQARLTFWVNDRIVNTMQIDLSFNNKYFGNNSSKVKAVKTSTITKSGKKVTFNIGGIKKTFNDNAIKDLKVRQITFLLAQFGTKQVLSFNGLYWAKFVKNNCDTWEDIPNKFSSNDIVTADCRNGEVLLNDTPTPSLGALGNDWEDFYLTPGLNQIGFSYSDWVKDKYAPQFRVRYREVFL